MFDPWKRARALRRLAVSLGQSQDALVAALVADLEVTARHARDHEVATARKLLARFQADGVFPVHPSLRLGERGPLGSVALLLGHQAPLVNLARGLAAAFVTGNTDVVVCLTDRLARTTPLVQRLVTDALPGVRFEQARPDAFVRQCLTDPYIRALFATGRASWMYRHRAAARRSRTRVIFEGYGNDPMVVFPDANPDLVATAAVAAMRPNPAQDPAGIQRVYVHNDLHDALVDRLVERASLELVGPPADPATTVGPVTSSDALAHVRWQLEEAQERGARARCGGVFQRLPDCRHETLYPTILTNCQPSMAVVSEPSPGPVLPVLTFGSAADALRLATDPLNGYTASLWGGNAAIFGGLARRYGHVLIDGTALERPEIRLDWGGFGRTSWVWEWSGAQFVQLSGPRDLVVEMSRPLEGSKAA